MTTIFRYYILLAIFPTSSHFSIVWLHVLILKGSCSTSISFQMCSGSPSHRVYLNFQTRTVQGLWLQGGCGIWKAIKNSWQHPCLLRLSGKCVGDVCEGITLHNTCTPLYICMHIYKCLCMSLSACVHVRVCTLMQIFMNMDMDICMLWTHMKTRNEVYMLVHVWI